MEVIDKAKDVINKIGNDVSQKAKEAAGVTKMNNQISQNERKIKTLYMEIGKYVYENLREDAPEEMDVKMAAIDSAKEQIKKCREEIMKFKGFRMCEQCKSEVTLSAAFCPACGQKMPEPEVDIVDDGEAKEVENPEEVVQDVAEVVEEASEIVEEVVDAVEETIEKTEE